jgi:EAL domain-containing protein (putative c-di-GMP-specific phosphodiesterase class I)/GGDEF domain-containing protein
MHPLDEAMRALMELALPHVVVWTRGPGLGADLVAALAAHPVEVSEVRGLVEARRAAAGRQPMLVVLVCPQDRAARVAEVEAQFPGKPILLVSDSPGQWAPAQPSAAASIRELPASQPVEELCWHVAEALSRTAYTLETPERRLGPMLIEIDAQGVVGTARDLSAIWFFPGPYPRPGASILPLLQAEDRRLFARKLEQAAQGILSFFPVRVLDHGGSPHPMHAGLRTTGTGTVSLILQPLIDCAPIVGRRRGTRDPLTGLIDRWELWRQMQQGSATDGSSAVVFARLDAFETIAASMDFPQVDEVFDRVASALTQLFPWPAAPSRLTGGAFLVLVRNLSTQRIRALASRLIPMVNRIGGARNPDDPRFGMSIGIARVTDGDHDLAVRLAETAVCEAHAAGGNRAVVAGRETLIRSRVGDLAANMDLEDWEVWLQPVIRGADGRPEFHEALARFGAEASPRISRPDFFTTGRLEGLLERFDRLVMLRSLELLTAHPRLRLSVNVTRETFELESFPEHFLGLLRDANVDAGRVILEISPACLTMPSSMVRRRLRHLHVAGIAVALDDFGSGVCVLRQLTDFPLSIVKLDGLVTSYVGDDPLQRNFVRMVVNLCRARGIQTVAEYTRTREQMERLVEDGVDLFQGELLGMPQPVTDALARFSQQPSHA